MAIPDRSSRSRSHWDHVYKDVATDLLGWYEYVPTASLQLIEKAGIEKSDRILDVGCGASTLVEALLNAGYRDLVATDISSEAIDRARLRLGMDRAELVRWIEDDVAHPTELLELRDVALWHDRALLHFLLDEDDRNAYRRVIDTVLKPGGWVIMAEFSVAGATKCSGLDVRNYDVEALARFLGSGFECVEHFDHQYTMPSGGLRPYVYALFHDVR